MPLEPLYGSRYTSRVEPRLYAASIAEAVFLLDRKIRPMGKHRHDYRPSIIYGGEYIWDLSDI